MDHERNKCLYMPVSTRDARLIYGKGFAGTVAFSYVTDERGEFVTDDQGDYVEAGVEEHCEFRDRPPAGLKLSLSSEPDDERTGEGVNIARLNGTPLTCGGLGDLVVSITVPEGVAEQYEIREQPPMGRSFREYWLPPQVANRYRDTLEVWVPEIEKRIPLELLAQDHAVIITERFAIASDPPGRHRDAFEMVVAGDDVAPDQADRLGADVAMNPVKARCVCGERWRWSRGGEDPQAAFAAWSDRHTSTS